MFFNTNDFNFKILSTVELQFEKHKKASETRPFHALSFRKSGDAEFTHGSLSFPAKQGTVSFVPAYYNYVLNTTETELIVVHFLSEDTLFDKIRVFMPQNPQYFERKFKELYDVWTKKGIGYEYECKSILYKIITKIEREFIENKSDKTTDTLLEAIEYIHDHFNEKELSVDYLSRMCGMSDTYFRKLFVKNFEVTPIQYIKNLKLSYAKELLMSGYYTVQEVSDKCGFSTVNYFCGFFKKETGYSPSKFISTNKF